MEAYIYVLIMTVFIAMTLFDVFVSKLNSDARDEPIPTVVDDIYDKEAYDKWKIYSRKQSDLSMFSRLFRFLFVLMMLMFGGFQALNLWALDVGESVYTATLLFFAILFLLETLFSGVFSWINTFKIEGAFGFNTTTKKTFFKDSLINFFLCSDKEILKIRNCNYENSLLDISSFLRKAKSENWKNKTLCLDLKLLYNPQINQSLQEREELLAFATKRLESTFKNTQFDLLIEIFNEKQYTYLDSIFQDKTFLVNYSPTEEFIKEMNEKSRKLSLPIYDLPKNLDPSNIEIKNLWTINTVNQFIEGLRFSPKIMQSDNIPMMHFFKSIQEGKRALRICSKNNVTKIKDNEFQSLLSLELPLAKEQLIEFKTIKGSFKKGVLLVFKAADENGNTVLWEKEELSENLKSYFFINSKFLVHKKSKTIQISIWNKSGSALNNTFNVSQFELH